MIDFEQATKDGDQAWDVAVFLYYSGHYLQPFYSNAKAEAVAKAFIAGYLKGGGNRHQQCAPFQISAKKQSKKKKKFLVSNQIELTFYSGYNEIVGNKNSSKTKEPRFS